MARATRTKRRSAVQLAADGFAALVGKLGMADALRYVQLYHQGAGDYSRDRHEWLDTLSHDQVLALMAHTTTEKARRRKNRKAPAAGR